MSLPELANLGKGDETTIALALEALKKGKETLPQLITLNCHRYSKLAMERFFLYPAINELFVKNIKFLKKLESS